MYFPQMGRAFVATSNRNIFMEVIHTMGNTAFRGFSSPLLSSQALADASRPPSVYSGEVIAG
jgi:hypothetical protein